MEALIIGFWHDLTRVQSRPTNLPPEPETLADQLRKQANMPLRPDSILYIEVIGGSPKVTYFWEVGQQYEATSEDEQIEAREANEA